jgi:ATP-dependent DNA ligase
MPTRRAVTLPLVDPIVPVLRDQPFDDPAYLFEPKYDGFRGLLYLSGRECHFRSKRGKVLKQFEQLCYWVREELGVKEAILDGEVVSLDPEGRQDFRGLLARRGNLHYAVFDVVWLNGKDLRGLALTRRKRGLERVIPATSTVLSRVFAVEGRGRDLCRKVNPHHLAALLRLAPQKRNPARQQVREGFRFPEWARRDSNARPLAPEASALSN